MADTDMLASVTAVHGEIDRRVGRFALESGLGCPPGCGACCRSPDVETTARDVAPMAAALLAAGLAEAVMTRLEYAAAGGEQGCVLYESDPVDPDRGRCSMYAWRPSVCRLFAFAGRRDADGRPRFKACRVHAGVQPAEAAAAERAVAEGRLSLPIFAELAGRLATPGPAGRLQPINAALADALSAAALSARLAAAAFDQDDGDGSRPTPSMPPRRAA